MGGIDRRLCSVTEPDAFLAHLRLLPVPRPTGTQRGCRESSSLCGAVRVSVSQINLLLDTVIASLLVTGSVSWLYYSDRLMELLLALLAFTGDSCSAGLSRITPNLHLKSSETLDWALRLVVLIALPATIGLILLAESLITLFRQNFPVDVVSSAGSLRAYAVGLLAFMGEGFCSGFYARQDTATPVRIGVIAMSANMFSIFCFTSVVGPYRFGACHESCRYLPGGCC